MKLSKGFSLIEMLAALVIIGILGATSYAFFGDQIRSSNRTEARATLSETAGLLEKCRSLAELDLEDHQISDLTPLKDLNNLQSLTLRNNRIQDITPLAGLTKLQYLQLEDNQIIDISPVAKMTNMHSLYLSNNRIKNSARRSGPKYCVSGS